MSFRMRLLVLVAVAVLAPIPVANAAQTALAAPDVFKNVPVTGSTAAGDTFAGTLDVNRFTSSNGQIFAVGRLTGTLTKADSSTNRLAGRLVRLPLSIDQASTSCQILHLVLGPLNLNLLGLVVHLNRVVLDVTAQSGPGNLLGNLLCGIAHLLDGGAPASSVVAALNQVARVLTGPDAFNNVPVHGRTANGDVFSGSLDVRNFTTGSGLFAVGRLTGTLTRADGSTSQIVGQTVEIPLEATGTCRILHLVLGPLNLNLLGLVVHLNRVVLDITAQSGPGNLLGNLLCGIAHLLDQNSPAAAATRMNTLRRVTRMTQNVPASGTFGPGGAGLLAGTLDLQRLREINGSLWALGRLSGVLVDPAGTVRRFADALVLLPVENSVASCAILHLELGPLNLNLLGLVVHLNRVVLDITAQSGPGNLLGNLLCNIAHLLDESKMLGVANSINSNLTVLRLLR